MFSGETPPGTEATKWKIQLKNSYFFIHAWGCAAMHAPASQFLM